jgi:hypothetical protein
LIDFINSLFQLPDQLLDEALSFLNHLSTLVGAGIQLSDYFSWVAVLGPAWVGVVESLIGSLVLIAWLLIIRSVYRIYLAAKDGIQWW